MSYPKKVRQGEDPGRDRGRVPLPRPGGVSEAQGFPERLPEHPGDGGAFVCSERGVEAVG